MARTVKRRRKYIFVVGGVMSGVGKGIATSSIAKILQSRGFEVTALKIDPYVNVDAGTMNPTEHGEVFVLDDGTECDQDMGNYERFLDHNFSKVNYMTTGSVYLSVIQKERNLQYRGRCVHVVPDIPLEVLGRIDNSLKVNRADIAIVEIGGTVGDYQNVLFLEAYRMLKFIKPDDAILVLVSYVPSLSTGGNELKTKPTQHAVRNLNAVGVHPDIVIARASVPLDAKRKEKLEFMSGLPKGSVISAPDIANIYQTPLNFEKEKISDHLLKKLNLKAKSKSRDLSALRKFALNARDSNKPVKIGLVGKYFGTGGFVLEDSYISVIEALKHAAVALKRKPILEWINAEDFDPANPNHKSNLKQLKNYQGVVVPGGFGSRGVEGKIQAIKYCRENQIPYFGLCYGMQLAVIEFARSVLRLKKAHTTEIEVAATHPVIDLMPEQKKNLLHKNYGATMRLGAYPAKLITGSIAFEAYGKKLISERHRHRYEVNPKYVEKLKKHGMVFSGISPDGRLMEIMELPREVHPFFLGTQFHPEFKSRPLAPHPLFLEFIKSADKIVLNE